MDTLKHRDGKTMAVKHRCVRCMKIWTEQLHPEFYQSMRMMFPKIKNEGILPKACEECLPLMKFEIEHGPQWKAPSDKLRDQVRKSKK